MASLSPSTLNRLVFVGFIFYVMVLLALQTGHLFWLLIVHTRLRETYGLDPQTPSHSWGFAGAAFLLVVMVAGPFCVVSMIRKYGDGESTFFGGRKWIMFFWPISLSIYNGQVIYFIVSTVHLYLDLKWANDVATCACHHDQDPLLNMSSYDVIGHCQCLVPGDDCPYQVSAFNVTDITDVDLARRGSSYGGDVIINVMPSEDDVNQWLDELDFDNNFQYVLVLVKASALVTVLHFPLWLMDHYLIQMASNVKDPGEDQSSRDGSTSKRLSEIISDLMAHTVYCFSENIDGFSLLDEYLEISNYLWGNGYFRDAVVSFLGANIILIAGYNGVARLLQRYQLATLIVRCLIVVLNNLPFMLLRIYMLWTVGGTRILNAGISTNLFFFITKEAVFLVVYFMEIGFSIYQYRIDKRSETSCRLDEGSSNDTTSTGMDTWNTQDSFEMDRSRSSRKSDGIRANSAEPRERKRRRKPPTGVPKRQDSLLEDTEHDDQQHEDYQDIATSMEPSPERFVEPNNSDSAIVRKKQRRRREKYREGHDAARHVYDNNVYFSDRDITEDKVVAKKRKRRQGTRTTEVTCRAQDQDSLDIRI